MKPRQSDSRDHTPFYYILPLYFNIKVKTEVIFFYCKVHYSIAFSPNIFSKISGIILTAMASTFKLLFDAKAGRQIKLCCLLFLSPQMLSIHSKWNDLARFLVKSWRHECVMLTLEGQQLTEGKDLVLQVFECNIGIFLCT